MLLHLGQNVITFRTLLHLGQNVITFRTLLHLGLFITFRPSKYGSVRIVHVVFLFCVLGIDVELARSIEERIMLEDAQSWMNGRTIHEIKDKSGMADEFTCLKVQKKGPKKKTWKLSCNIPAK